jgi:hypothetical protein
MSISRSVLRIISRNGRPMTLRRRIGTTGTFTTASVKGFMVSFSPSEISGLVQQGDARVTIAADVAALVSPRENDTVLVDGKAWRVMGFQPLYHAYALSGWRLWVRGGAT